MSKPISITLTFDTPAQAASAMLVLAGPQPAFKITPEWPAAASSTPEAEAVTADAAAPAEEPAKAEAQPEPQVHVVVPRRTRKPKNTEATGASAPADVPASAAEPQAAPVVEVFPTVVTPETPEDVAARLVPFATAAEAIQKAPLAPIVDAVPAKAQPTLPELQAAIERLFAAKGSGVTIATLQRFGVKRGRDVVEDQRAAFVEYIDNVIAGKINAVTGEGA